jgi:hypothetical protein
MSDVSLDRALLNEVQEGAEAMALLAGNEETFRAAVDAFRARDGESMQLLLNRHGLAERCEVVCHWLRSKECVVLCLELSGPPTLDAEPPQPREFAEVVGRVTADEELVGQIVIAIEERDADGWNAFIKQQGLERFSHLLCHWACTVYYRLVCDVVCQPVSVKPAELVPALQAAGQAISRLAEDEKAFAAGVDAVSANDCKRLIATVAEAGLASVGQVICEWFCSWRCMLLCLRLFRAFPAERLESPIEEMLEFALATGRLATERGTLERLSAAVLRGDTEAVQSLVEKFSFERYCIQFCHWVCFLRCQRFCSCAGSPTQCAITGPTGCAAEQADPVHGLLFVPILGTAGGTGTYTLMIQEGSDPPIAGVISYPGGGASGTAPVIGGTLGQLNTSSLSDGAYTITLTVHPGGLESPATCTTSITFNLLKIGVYISLVDGVPALPNAFDQTAELMASIVAAQPPVIRSFGGDLSLAGSAYVYGCASEEVANFELRYARVDGPPAVGPSQPAKNTDPLSTAITDIWPLANRLHAPLVYDATKYYPCTRVGEAPTNLIDDWGTQVIGSSVYPILVPSDWDSTAATPSPDDGGRFSLLLIVQDTAGNTYYDLQNIWIDNWQVLCQIVKFQRPGAAPGTWVDVPPCTDILISWGTLRIIGIAWDHLIDDGFPATAPTNDNFNQYALSFNKQFQSAESLPITSPTTRVPNALTPVPTDTDPGLDNYVLADWDLTSLDAGTLPLGGSCGLSEPPDPNHLYRGCSCTFDLTLGVSDWTDSDEPGVHDPTVTQPLKIVNDIPPV